MKALIVEDDYITSQVMGEIVGEFGRADVAEDGAKGIELFAEAHQDDDPYDVIFLDIMMPEIDGQETLEKIREVEVYNGIKGLDGVKVVMTTALDDFDNIKKAFVNQAEGYVVKPIERDKIVKKLIELGFVENPD